MVPRVHGASNFCYITFSPSYLLKSKNIKSFKIVTHKSNIFLLFTVRVNFYYLYLKIKP